MLKEMHYRPIRTTLPFSDKNVTQRFSPPPTDLESLVLEYWEIQVSEPDCIVPVQILPHGTLSIRFNISENDVEAVLYGPSTKGRMQGVFQKEIEVIGAAIRPEKAYSLLGLPIEELRDYRFQMQELWPRRIARLKEQLLETKASPKRITLISDFLRSILQPDITPSSDYHLALHSILKSPGDQKLDDILKEQNLSGRTLRRHFNKYLGLGPKHMNRVVRFQSAIKAFSRGSDLTLAEVAADAGYFDQSHLNREFRQLSSLTPEQFRSQIGQYHNRQLDMWKGLAPSTSSPGTPTSFKFR